MNLTTPYSAPSAEEIHVQDTTVRVSGSAFQPLMVSVSDGDLICRRMIISAASNKGGGEGAEGGAERRSSICILALPFRLLKNDMSLQSLLHFLRDSHFKCSTMPVMLLVSKL